MLKTISIESFEVPLRFITRPNGYGKTTILKIFSTNLYCNINTWARERGLEV